MAQKTWEVSVDEYRFYRDEYYGLCLKCGDWRGGVEPDAQGYECYDCGEREVVGTDIALIEEHIVFIDLDA